MSKRSTKSSEPSKASLDEMPEIDFSKVGKLSRGKYAQRAQRSLEILALDKKVVTALGGPDAVSAILRALAAALQERRPRKRRAA
jgi:hypothetical protein